MPISKIDITFDMLTNFVKTYDLQIGKKLYIMRRNSTHYKFMEKEPYAMTILGYTIMNRGKQKGIYFVLGPEEEDFPFITSKRINIDAFGYYIFPDKKSCEQAWDVAFTNSNGVRYLKKEPRILGPDGLPLFVKNPYGIRKVKK